MKPCEVCDTANLDHSKTCFYCGHQFEDDDWPEAPLCDYCYGPLKESADGIMRCPQCETK